jgi:hypothetical protein
VPAGSTVGQPRCPWATGEERAEVRRWALTEAATHAARNAYCRDRYERMKGRLGRQRGAKVARIDLARPRQTLGWMKPSEALAKVVALTD